MSRGRVNYKEESDVSEEEGSDFEEEHPTRKKGKKKVESESESEDASDSDDEPRRKKVNLKRGKTPTKTSKSPAKKKSPSKSSSKKKDSEKEKAKPASKPKKKRGDDDDEDDIKKMFMPGQKYETPPDDDPLFAYYTSLFEQKPESKLAKKWCMENGALDPDTAQKIYDEFEKEKRKKK